MRTCLLLLTLGLPAARADGPPPANPGDPVPAAVAGPEPKAAVPAPPAAAEAAGPKKSKLEEEATPRDEDEDPTLILLLVLVCLMIGVPMGIFALASMGKPSRQRRVDLDDDEDDRPSRRRRDAEDNDRPRQHQRERDADNDRARRPHSPAAEPPRPPAPEQPPQQAPARTTARPELARRLAGHVAPVAPAAAPVVEHGEAPPYFLVRATYRSRHERMTRIYIRTTEILVIDAGPGADLNVGAGLAAAALTGGGVIGAFVGGAVGGMVADALKAKGEAIQQRLNQLDLVGLLEAARTAGNLRAPLTGLVGVTIDPPSKSRRADRTSAVGTFRFRHLKGGEYTFEFLNGAELRGAVELLRRVLGPALHVGQGWDEATAVYLRGVI